MRAVFLALLLTGCAGASPGNITASCPMSSPNGPMSGGPNAFSCVTIYSAGSPTVTPTVTATIPVSALPGGLPAPLAESPSSAPSISVGATANP